MGYRMPMGDERKPGEKLAEGWHKFKVVKVSMETSTKGNEMLVWWLQEEETGKDETVYTITEHKKRWALKEILEACEVKVEDGEVYVFEFKDLIGKTIGGKIKHEPNSWVDNDGNKREGTKARIVEFRNEIPF